MFFFLLLMNDCQTKINIVHVDTKVIMFKKKMDLPPGSSPDEEKSRNLWMEIKIRFTYLQRSTAYYPTTKQLLLWQGPADVSLAIGSSRFLLIPMMGLMMLVFDLMIFDDQLDHQDRLIAFCYLIFTAKKTKPEKVNQTSLISATYIEIRRQFNCINYDDVLLMYIDYLKHDSLHHMHNLNEIIY